MPARIGKLLPWAMPGHPHPFIGQPGWSGPHDRVGCRPSRSDTHKLGSTVAIDLLPSRSTFAIPPGGPYIRFRLLQLLSPHESAGAAAPPIVDRAGSTALAPGVSGGRLTPDGFSARFQEHHRALWCIAAAIVRDRDLAHDVVQEAAVIALGKLSEFDPATSFPAWCGQVVRFVALNHRKKSVRSHARSTDPGVLAAIAPAADGQRTVSVGFTSRLAEALDTLDETARACLLMKTVMDMSYKHIAECLGIPEGTAMSHVHRSRQALRTRLTAHTTEVEP